MRNMAATLLNQVAPEQGENLFTCLVHLPALW